MKLSTLLILATASVSLLACSPPQKHRKPVPQANAHHYHLTDGRDAIETSDGVWYYYAMGYMNGSTEQNYAYVTPGASLPPGGSYVKGAAPTAEEIEGVVSEPAMFNEQSATLEPMPDPETYGMDTNAETTSTDSPSSSSDSGSSDGGGGGGGE